MMRALPSIDLMSTDIDGCENLSSVVSLAGQQNSVLPVSPDTVGILKSGQALEVQSGMLRVVNKLDESCRRASLNPVW